MAVPPVDNELEQPSEAHSSYKPQGSHNDKVKYHLTGMYQDWFLDYASYVILDRKSVV